MVAKTKKNRAEAYEICLKSIDRLNTMKSSCHGLVLEIRRLAQERAQAAVIIKSALGKPNSELDPSNKDQYEAELRVKRARKIPAFNDLFNILFLHPTGISRETARIG